LAADPLVYIVILNYRNFADTIECVRSLENITYPNSRIVIVDNDSDNESEDVLRKAFPEHIVIQAGRNGGYAAGNNVGIRRGLSDGAEFVLILNNDTIVEPDFLSILVSHALSDPIAGLLSPSITYSTGEFNRNCTRRRPRLRELFWNFGIGRWLGQNKAWLRRCQYEDEPLFEEPTEVEVIAGACMLLSAPLIDEIGLLDENTFLFWEEFILHEKMRRTQYRTVIVPRSRVTHKQSKSLKTIGSRAAIANIRSLNYYLREYRDVTAIVRIGIVLSVMMNFAPGILKTITGLRKLETALKSKSG
jgi:GT2 family glycosyltransferase